jgi:hypothetical protein
MTASQKLAKIKCICATQRRVEKQLREIGKISTFGRPNERRRDGESSRLPDLLRPAEGARDEAQSRRKKALKGDDFTSNRYHALANARA